MRAVTSPTVVRVAPGAAAARALAAEVRAAKAGDPFAAVHVVVRAEDAAVQVRRAVAREAGGIAAIDTLPLDRLARTVLAAAGVIGLRTAPRPVLAAALRRAAHQGDRALAASADQQSTQDALVATYHELTALGDTGLRVATQRPGLGGSVARVVQSARQALAANGWLDDAALLGRAAEAAPGVALPPIVVLRTDVPTPVEAAFVEALGRTGQVRIVETAESAPPARRLDVVAATDPDEEVRAAVRLVATALAEGVPADRVALAFTVDQPYRRIAAEHLADAGIEWNGSAAGSLLESPAGRVALAAAADGPVGASWRVVADHVREVVAARAPDDEATRAVLRLAAQLPALDAWGPPPGSAATVDTIHTELAAVLPRVGRVGRGVTVGTLRRALDGAPWRVVVVVGAAEGWAPSGSAGASLLTDSDRRALGVPTGADQDARQRARLAAVVGGATHAVVSWPAADLRRTSRRSPSRWVADLADATRAIGGPVRAVSLPTAYAAVARTPSPLATDRRRRRALADPAALALDDPAFAIGWTALRARLSPEPTAFDGDLRGEDLTPLRLGELVPVAPTLLEKFARCGRQYFTTQVLGVREPRTFDELVGPDALTDGNIVHRVLERAVAEEDELGRPLTRAEQAALVTEAIDREEQLRTVPELLRRQHRRSHLGRLWRALDADAEDRADGRRPQAMELRFGNGDGFAVTLPDGRRLAVRGSIDRVDRLPDGSLAVLDYKSGGVTKGTPDDPLLGGRALQLAVYALAAEARFGAPVSTIEYRQVARDVFKRHPAPAAGAVEALGPVLAALVACIEGGVFLPAEHGQRQPGRPTCPVCDPHGLLARQQARRARVLLAGFGSRGDADDDGDLGDG